MRYLLCLLLLATTALGQEIDPDPEPEHGKREGLRPPGEGMFTPIFPTLPGSKGVTRTRPDEEITSVSWQSWWELNRAAFLDVRGRYLRRGEKAPLIAGSEPKQPTHFELAREVSPTLAEIAKGNKELWADALLAWVRSATAEDAEHAVEEVLARLKQSKASDRDRLILYLGISREALGFDPLYDVLHDTVDGRELLGHSGSIPVPSRAAAALAFGAMGDVDAVEDLLKVLREADKRSAADLKTACIVSLGILAGSSKPDEREEVLATLREGLGDSRWPIEARAAAPVALVRIGGQREVAHMDSLLTSVRLPREVRRSCAQAIGLGAEHLSAQIFESLSTVAERESDAPLRAFAVMALGEIAARGGFDATLAGRSRKRLLDAVEHFYVSAIRGSKRAAVDRPWYLISAGLFAGQFEESRPAIAAQLLRAVNKERAKEARAAAVVALSLTKDASASTALLGRLDKAKEIESRARIVEALGVLGAQETTDQLLSILRKDGPERLRYHAAIGLGFLADAELLAEFHGRIANSDSDPERAVVARVVGELGDRASIDPLLELAGGEKLDVELRRHALWGLGTLGRHAEPNWRFPFGRGLNFLAASPAMQMLLEMR